uniref:Uncharacterized protein n=1 Tax=Rhizophora mucronata TaxID=61149 RepID=A0A2P2Q3T5_RHIMU
MGDQSRLSKEGNHAGQIFQVHKGRRDHDR